MPKVVRGEGREQTFDKFKTALQTARRDEVVILLVDSEEPVAAGHSPWQHLRNGTIGNNHKALRTTAPILWYKLWRRGFSPTGARSAISLAHS